MMARAALLLLPPVSAVLVIVAVRWLCRRRLLLLLLARARAHHPSPVPVEKSSGGELPAVALYSRRKQQEEASPECVFCLSGIEEGSEVRELSCRHLFHRPCLDRWILQQRPLATCPLCRRRLFLLPPAAPPPPWAEEYDQEEDSDSDMMLFMACVHSRSSWFWPS